MSVYHFSYAYTITEVRNSEMKSETFQERYSRRDCFHFLHLLLSERKSPHP